MLRSKRVAIWIGTSGWVYKHWKGIFYPEHLPAAEQLAFYARNFSTVEVNFSFYRLPERSVFEHWKAQTPAGFLFAVKGSRFLTHIKRLKDPEEPLRRLMDRASGLEEKLGPILFQFPHTWAVNIDRLAYFLEALGAYHGWRFAFEFRHESWLTEEVCRLLERADAALCLPVCPGMPLAVRLTAPWTYIRMHHGARDVGYDDDELKLWARRIRGFRDQGADVYVYFNNDFEAYATRNAERLCKMMG